MDLDPCMGSTFLFLLNMGLRFTLEFPRIPILMTNVSNKAMIGLTPLTP